MSQAGEVCNKTDDVEGGYEKFALPGDICNEIKTSVDMNVFVTGGRWQSPDAGGHNTAMPAKLSNIPIKRDESHIVSYGYKV